MSLQHAPESGGQRVVGERYAIVQHLATGGAGAIYEAEHLQTGARVALKLCCGCDAAGAAAKRRLQAEARIIGAIDSEHVVRIFDADTRGATPFLALELLRGHTLEDAARAPMPPQEVVELLTQVAHGLARVHAAGFVHCDLKPENIFVGVHEDGTRWVKLLDFGIAERIGADDTDPTIAGSFMGTPSYMSPEQGRGQHDAIDQRADTWAMGMIAFRLLYGQPYFPQDELRRMLVRLFFSQLRAPSEAGCSVSRAFDAWFLRSCSRQLEERFESPIEQVESLRRALESAEDVQLSEEDYRRGVQLDLDCNGWTGVDEAGAWSNETPSGTAEQAAATVLEKLRAPCAPDASGPGRERVWSRARRARKLLLGIVPLLSAFLS